MEEEEGRGRGQVAEKWKSGRGRMRKIEMTVRVARNSTKIRFQVGSIVTDYVLKHGLSQSLVRQKILY